MEQKRKILTLCLAVKEGRLLLGMKKRGFGEGDAVSEKSLVEIESTKL